MLSHKSLDRPFQCRTAPIFCAVMLLAPVSLCFADSGSGKQVSGQSTTKIPAVVSEFTLQNCNDCHSGENAEAGFDLAALSSNLNDPHVYKKWVHAFDRVASGEMPPSEDLDVPKLKRDKFLNVTKTWLRQFKRRDDQKFGRVRGRRLNNLQLERSLHDLLGIDIPLKRELPDEPRSSGFTTVADGQPMSHFQLERHLGVVDLALDEAFRRAVPRPDIEARILPARQLVRKNPKRRTREPELRNGKAVTWSSTLVFYGRLPSTTAKESGWYRVSVKASAVRPPQDRGVWCTVRTGKCVSSSPLLTWATAFEATSTPKTHTFDVWLPRGEMLEIRPGDATLKRARFNGGQVGTGEGESQNVPGIGLHSVSMTRIHQGPNNKKIRERLFGDLPFEIRWQKDAEVLGLKLKSKAPRKDAKRLIQQFAQRAFRRPVADADLTPFVELVISEQKSGKPFAEALRGGYRALLCSSRFLYLNEAPGKLDDYAIASRLSYMLWNTMPDAELLNLAKSNQLRKPAVLRAQTDRMLRHPRGQNFVKDFAHEWLDLSEIDFTQPDRKQFREFDVIVQESMVDETQAFLQRMLDKNLSVTNLIKSDFTFLNSRLASHYDIKNVKGDELRSVKLDANNHRGGILTQGSVLKVTANGTTTSPVIRGVWIAERLLGQEIPPPPSGIPAIEPDVRGAKSIRDMLDKHRSNPDCASCHVKIDPPGFALENFDPAGQWRDRYGFKKRARGPLIDASYQLADGRKFKNLTDFQTLICKNPAPLARNVASKLLTYGTGGPVSFSDRPAVWEIINQTKDNNYGFRSLLDSVIGSPTFLHK